MIPYFTIIWICFYISIYESICQTIFEFFNKKIHENQFTYSLQKKKKVKITGVRTISDKIPFLSFLGNLFYTNLFDLHYS